MRIDPYVVLRWLLVLTVVGLLAYIALSPPVKSRRVGMDSNGNPIWSGVAYGEEADTAKTSR
jgi:hypothetical protein